MRGRSFKDYLKKVFPGGEKLDLHSSLEIIGDIAILKLPALSAAQERLLGEAVAMLNKQVKSVFKQIGPVEGGFRTRGLQLIYGENRTETVHREHGCLLKVDVSKAYFSPKLQFERRRIAEMVEPWEVVVNMFAGVGSFSMVIAKIAKPAKVYSIDINPDAVRYLEENIRLNRVESVVEPILADAKEAAQRLRGTADRVLMPLPAKAYEYLPYAVQCLKPGGEGWIHYYDFVHAAKGEDPVVKTVEKVARRLEGKFTISNGRIVRSTGPRWFQTALDIKMTPF
ncbi:class I SAM-dependent methyltransferase family protein [Candidatus Hecatella orcuttiae]|jgi:tRNA (guanine37-N1)-methyltransferase|uniref:class I SAM-dependent methyltransferase n=1 Tax=Candidatus Hecatella orcuttiae TaxID=1935119 RepID=UPI002867B583|nr:class I SAM-dependent methyltransferase family protein [Candidatus Hecatella orcuttiae]